MSALEIIGVLFAVLSLLAIGCLLLVSELRNRNQKGPGLK